LATKGGKKKPSLWWTCPKWAFVSFSLSQLNESSNLKFSKYVYQTMWMRNILWFEDGLRVLHSRNCSGFSIVFYFILFYLFIYNFEKWLTILCTYSWITLGYNLDLDSNQPPWGLWVGIELTRKRREFKSVRNRKKG